MNIAGEHGEHAEKKVHEETFLYFSFFLFFCRHLCCCFDGGLEASLWLQWYVARGGTVSPGTEQCLVAVNNKVPEVKQRPFAFLVWYCKVRAGWITEGRNKSRSKVVSVTPEWRDITHNQATVRARAWTTWRGWHHFDECQNLEVVGNGSAMTGKHKRRPQTNLAVGMLQFVRDAGCGKDQWTGIRKENFLQISRTRGPCETRGGQLSPRIIQLMRK